MDSVTLRYVIFVLATLVFTFISRRALRNPRSHGFYRYFAFIGITSLVLYNHPVWFEQPFSALHCLSWLLLLSLGVNHSMDVFKANPVQTSAP